jgi:hypothetical protein
LARNTLAPLTFCATSAIRQKPTNLAKNNSCFAKITKSRDKVAAEELQCDQVQSKNQKIGDAKESEWGES